MRLPRQLHILITFDPIFQIGWKPLVTISIRVDFFLKKYSETNIHVGSEEYNEFANTRKK